MPRLSPSAAGLKRRIERPNKRSIKMPKQKNKKPIYTDKEREIIYEMVTAAESQLEALIDYFNESADPANSSKVDYLLECIADFSSDFAQTQGQLRDLKKRS
jgi:hypothetical protein